MTVTGIFPRNSRSHARGSSPAGYRHQVVDNYQIRLGDVQQTLLIPLAARAAEARKERPILRDPRAVEIIELVESTEFDIRKFATGWVTSVMVLRTAIFDAWIRDFLLRHPDGTVVEIGTGLNTRFERVDNGRVHWIDLDLPDSIELRRKFFTDTDRRRMVEASVLDEDWLDIVAERPGPYFFVADGVLVYLAKERVDESLTRIRKLFPDSMIAFDTYQQKALEQQHRTAAGEGMSARWSWSCADPHEFERLGMRVVESTTIARPPRAVSKNLPFTYRALLPLAHPLMRRVFSVSLFQV